MLTNATNGANGKTKQSHADWETNSRWSGITRPYSYDDVLRLRGTIKIEYTLARLGAERLWNLMHSDAYVPALGAITGNQAIEMVQAGLKAITVRAGKWPRTATRPVTCTPTRVCIRATPRRIS